MKLVKTLKYKKLDGRKNTLTTVLYLTNADTPFQKSATIAIV